ncbi:peptidoglycan-binding domain-containing protein, partial [Achromobacter sp.]
SSHYSGSGSRGSSGYYSAPATPVSPPAKPSPLYTPSGSSSGSNGGVPSAGSAPRSNANPSASDTSKKSGSASQDTVDLSRSEKLKLQIIRVQIKLTSLHLYEGPINGVLGPATTAALKHFQTVKSLPATGLMTTETMNALGVVVAR